MRTEQVTIVMNYGGDVVLPAVSLSWWNMTANQVEVASIEALTISVAGPVVEGDKADQRQSVDWRAVVLTFMSLAIVAFLLRRYLPLVRQRARSERERYLNSEAYAFDKLTKACRRQDPGVAYEALLAWERKFCPEPGLQRLAERYGNQQLLDCMEGLSAQLFAAHDSSIRLADLSAAVSTLRDRLLVEQKRQGEMALPELNPGTST